MIKENIIIKESSLSRVWQHTQSDNPFGVITGFRDEFTQKEKLENNQAIADDARAMGFGFFYLDGYWIENEGTENEKLVNEDSLFIIGSEGDDVTLEEFILENGKRYKQDGVLIKTSKGVILHDLKKGTSFTINNLSVGNFGAIYSRLRNNKKTNTFIFENERTSKGFFSKYLEHLNRK